MRILGIDYGDRRIGLALSDALQLVAGGLETLTNSSREHVLDHLRRLVAEREVSEIVVGLPKNMNGSLGPQAEKTMQFAEELKILGRPVHLVDERLTTERAQRVMTDAGLSRQKRHKKVDRMAAQLILQAYLDARAKRRERREEGLSSP